MTRTVEEAAALVASGDTECAPCTLRANYEGYSDDALSRRVAALVSLVAAGDRPAAAWSGPIGFENLATGDGRMIEANALSWDTPVPLMWAPEHNGGHQGDRKSTRLNPVTNAHIVCRLLLEKKKQ